MVTVTDGKCHRGIWWWCSLLVPVHTQTPAGGPVALRGGVAGWRGRKRVSGVHCQLAAYGGDKG